MKEKKRCMVFSILIGLLFAFCCATGAVMEGNGGGTTWIITFLGIGSGVALLTFLLWQFGNAGLDNLYGTVKDSRFICFLMKHRDFTLPFWIKVLLFVLLWTPAWLSIFPGAFAYDAYDEWMQVREQALTAHHPVLHVLWVGYCVEGAYRLFGSYNVGIAIYTISQMMMLACVFAYVLSFLRRYGLPAWARGLMMLFWGLSPVVQLFAVSVTKDTLFAGAFLVFLLSLVDLKCRREEFLGKRSRKITFIISALGTMILRNNGLYVVLIILGILVVFYRKEWKRLLGPMIAILAIYWLYVGPFYSALGIQKGGIQEMFSVPLQQMARVYKYNYEELAAEDIVKLEELIPIEDLQAYRPKVADFVKTNFRSEVFHADKAGYLKLWLKWGLKYPMTYVKSFLIMTVDYWYPGATVDGYEWGDGDTDYFDYSVNTPGERIYMFPQMHAYYKSLSKDWDTAQNPLVKVVMNPGVYFMLFLYMGAYFGYKRENRFWLPWIAVMLSWLTVLLGPIALVRYVLIFYFAMPVFVSMILHENCYSIMHQESR